MVPAWALSEPSRFSPLVFLPWGLHTQIFCPALSPHSVGRNGASHGSQLPFIVGGFFILVFFFFNSNPFNVPAFPPREGAWLFVSCFLPYRERVAKERLRIKRLIFFQRALNVSDVTEALSYFCYPSHAGRWEETQAQLQLPLSVFLVASLRAPQPHPSSAPSSGSAPCLWALCVLSLCLGIAVAKWGKRHQAVGVMLLMYE